MSKFTNSVKGAKSILATFALLFVCKFMSAQFITYPVPAQTITRGLDSTTLTVQISFPACTGVTVRIDLGATNGPGLIQYIPGSVTKLSGVGTITESNISNLASPVFSIGNTTIGQTLVFTIKRRAFCGVSPSTKDDIVVTGASCSFSETDANVNSYGLLSSAFTITPPSSLVNTVVGNTYNRTIGIINGGNGCADTIGFWIKYPPTALLLNSLSFGGTPITPVFSNGDSTYYELTGAMLGADHKLCNGETVSLVENVTVLKCNGITTYGAAGFDYTSSRCQVTTAVSGMSMSNAIPSLVVTAAPNILSPCFVSGPRTATYTITNNGAGPATNIVINTGNNFLNIPRGDSYGYIDTASLMITPSTGAPFHPDNSYYTGFTTTFSSPDLNNLACNVGKIAHLQLTLPPTIVLGAGQSITVTYNMIYCPSTNSCGDMYTGNPQGTQVQYKNACANTSYSTGNYVGSTSFPYNTASITSFEFQAQVRAGDCYDVTLSTVALPTNNISSKGYVEYELTIPAGVTLSSVNLIGFTASPHAGYPRIVGNKVITRYAINTAGNPVKFTFCSPISLCGTVNLDAAVTVSPDSTCQIADPSKINTAKQCATAPISFVCTGTCTGGGTVPVYWKYKRKNYGAPDNNYNKLSDETGSINPLIVFQDRYRPGDTLHSEYRSYLAAQTSPAVVNSWSYINSNWNFSKHIWSPVGGSATVTIKRGATVTVVPGVPIVTTSYGKIFNADFSQAPVALTSLAPFLPNDSVIVEADFVLLDSLISTSSYSSHMTVVDDGTRGKSYADAPEIVLLRNSVHASTVANPSAAQQYTCFVPLYNANTLHLFNFSLLYGNILNGCTAAKHEIRGYTRKLGGYTSNYFPGEYRPEFIPDSLILSFPVGMTVISGTQTVSGLYINTPPTSSLVSNANVLPYVSISGSSVTGTTVTLDVKAALANNPTWKIQSEGTSYTFSIDARGSCATPNSFSIDGTQNGHLYQWQSPSNEALFSDPARSQVSSSYSTQNKPNVNLSSPDATVSPSSDTACWNLLLQNSSAQAAPYNFVRISNNASFGNYIVKVGSTTLTANADGLFELGNIAGGATLSISVCATTNICVLDSIHIESGWDCQAYPTGAALTGYSCWKDLWVKADPLESQVQLTVDQQPQPEIALCQNDSIIFKINSALANYADNPQFRVRVPVGMTITSGEIEYPDGSGDWQTIIPDTANGLLVYKVEAHSAVSPTGLPGTIANPGTANRAARLKINYVTNCDFVSGSKVSVQQRADRPCGDPISSKLGNGGLVRANPIIITGAGGAGTISFVLGLAPDTISCNSSTTISGSIIPSGISTTNSDTIVVTLPAGVAYGGNFVSADGITLAPGYPVIGVGGSEILKFKIPVGITSGTPMNYSLDVIASAVDNGCGRFSILSEVERSFAALSCGVITCPNFSQSIIGSTENTIVVEKPNLTITNVDYVSGYLVAGGTATVTVTVANTSDIAAAAGAYNVEFFCGNSTVPFATSVFTPAIGAQSSATTDLVISVPDSPVCENEQIVTAVIRPNTNLNQPQCLCQQTSRPILQLLPVVIETFNAKQNSCKTILNWHSITESALKQYDVEYSADGRNYTTIASVAGKGDNSSYSFNYQPATGRAYYRLHMIERSGVSKYSSIIAMNVNCNGKNVMVYPNPANSILNINLNGFVGNINGKLFNGVGQLLMAKQLINGSNNMNVGNLPTGTYALIVFDENGSQQVYKVQIAH